MSRRLASWLLAAAAAGAISACGDGDGGTIPRANAEAMRSALDRVEANRAAGVCANVQDAAGEFQAAVNQLGADVERQVKAALQEGAANLVQLSQDPDQCGATGTTGEQQTSVPPPEETPTVEPPAEEPETDEPPPEEGDGGGGNGGGSPNDDGGSGGGSGGTGSDKRGD